MLLACPAFEVFFGGARGGGKTDGMLGEFASHAGLYGADAIGLMVRRTRTQLVETIERSKAIYTQLGAKFHETEKMWRFPDGARLRFAYLERDADADSYQGHSYTRVYVEEIGTFPNPRPIMKLMATLRSGAGVPVGFRATGNPGGPGHQWVKTRYIDPAPSGWESIIERLTNPWTNEVVERERIYIPSKITDNSYLGADYIANLQMAGSEQLVKAWLEGDWSAVEGAYFDYWRTDRHVIAPIPIPDEWLRFRSMDWGYAAPFSVGWWAVASDDTPIEHDRVIPRGAMVRYREWYGVDEKGEGLRLTAEEVAAGVRERDEKETFTYSVLDPAAFSHDSGPSIAERMAQAGVLCRRADNKRVATRGGALGGWDQMRARLKGVDGVPRIYCFDTCKHSIRTIPVLQHDLDRLEDLDTDQEDHAADEWRYGCMSRPYTPTKKKEPRPPMVYTAESPNKVLSNFTIQELIDRNARQQREL